MASSTGIQVPELAHNSLGVADIAVQTVFLVLGLVAVCLRVWSRHLRLDSLQFNDWLIVAAMVSVLPSNLYKERAWSILRVLLGLARGG